MAWAWAVVRCDSSAHRQAMAGPEWSRALGWAAAYDARWRDHSPEIVLLWTWYAPSRATAEPQPGKQSHRDSSRPRQAPPGAFAHTGRPVSCLIATDLSPFFLSCLRIRAVLCQAYALDTLLRPGHISHRRPLSSPVF
jgi:hypothetical protein